MFFTFLIEKLESKKKIEMKKLFELVVKFLAFFSTICVVVDKVEGSGGQTLKQYYECKNLKMTKRVDNFNRTIYVPNPSIKNNLLNDSFYRSLGLANMNLDQALDFMGRIYLDIDKLSKNASAANFVECTKTAYDHRDVTLVVLFRNATILAQARPIVSAFIEKFKSFYSSNYNSVLTNYFGQANLTTLYNFFVQNEFCLSRTIVYNSSISKKEFPAEFRSRAVRIKNHSH